MRPRIPLMRFLLGVSWLLQSLPIAVLRPDDLIELNRRKYARPKGGTYGWDREELVDAGLTPDETALLDKIPVKEGRLLILCVGVGREAGPLAKMGFRVTGIDFIPQMVERAEKNAKRRGVKFEGMVQEISNLDVQAGAFDIVWLSAGMLSHIPTQKRRVAMLKKINAALKPDGYFLCEFHMGSHSGTSRKMEFIRKAFAFITLGNRWYEEGDMVGHFRNMEFLHSFSSEAEILSEFEAGGFKLSYFRNPAPGKFGAAVLKKDITKGI